MAALAGGWREAARLRGSAGARAAYPRCLHPDRRHCFRQFAEAVWRKIESRFIKFFFFPLSPPPLFLFFIFFFHRALLKSVKLIHFLTKLKCFVLPAESLVTLRGPPSSQNELMDPLGRAECLPPLPPLLSDTVNLNQFQSLIIITNPSTVHLLLYNSNTAHDWVSARGAGAAAETGLKRP